MDYDFMFLVWFVLVLIALAISNLVALKKPSAPPGSLIFGVLYLIGAIILIFYKLNNP